MRLFSIDRGFWCAAAVVFGSGAWSSPAVAQYTRVERFPIADEITGIPVKETLIISTIQGRVVNARVRLNFQTVGAYDASLFAVGLFQGSRGVGVSGSSLGWFGPGSFAAEFDSPDLNGEIDFAGSPFATWFMVRSSGLPGGAGVVGVFSGSSFDIEYIPDCPADLDGDGFVGLGDVASIIGAWGDDSPRALQDLDVDGQVGLGDLAVVINAWGLECPCPNCRSGALVEESEPGLGADPPIGRESRQLANDD